MYLSSVSSRLLLHDINVWEIKKSYGCYEGICRDINWSDDGKYLLQVNPKGVVEILSTADNDVKSLQHIPVRDTWSACFHRDGHRNVALGTKSGNVLIWDTKNKSITKSFPTPTQQSSVNHVSFNSKNYCLAATMQNGDTVVYGLASNIPVMNIRLQSSKSISAMKFHQESRSLLGLATDEGHLLLRDITTNKDKAYFDNVHGSPVCDFAYSLINKDVVLSCGYDKVTHIYDIRVPTIVSTVRTSFPLSSISINSDNQVALGTINGTIIIYELRDLSCPLKMLDGHEEEVRRVKFQPLRKKSLSTEVSLREDTENISPQLIYSPITNRNSDKVFLNTDSPVKNDVSSCKLTNKTDSFLVMMGLDKSAADELDNNKTQESERNSEIFETRNHLDIDKNIKLKKEGNSEIFETRNHLDIDKNINSASTPLNSKNVENIYFSSPVNNNCIKIENVPLLRFIDENQTNMPKPTETVDSKALEEMKELIDQSLTTIADDSRNYFLHVMMELIKQKLYLRKQLDTMNDQMLMLTQNQNALVESNRKLVLEIEKLNYNIKKRDSK